jgi:hypothetical protein
MNKFFISICITTMLLLFSDSFYYTAKAEESTVKIPISFSYSSVYWWRGVELNGDGVGVLWPGIGIEFMGLSITYTSGISEDWITKETTAEEDAEKVKTEMDYGASFSTDRGMLSLGFGVMFVQYPYYDKVDKEATDPSFWEGSAFLRVNTILTPTLDITMTTMKRSMKEAMVKRCQWMKTIISKYLFHKI